MMRYQCAFCSNFERANLLKKLSFCTDVSAKLAQKESQLLFVEAALKIARLARCRASA